MKFELDRNLSAGFNASCQNWTHVAIKELGEEARADGRAIIFVYH
jgi:hypothetical protein